MYDTSRAADLNHEPFSAKAYSPVMNSSHQAPWLLVRADLGAQPLAHPVSPERDRLDGLGRVEAPQVRPGAPEPRKELESPLLGAGHREVIPFLPAATTSPGRRQARRR